jgi:thioredoxin 1
MNNIRKIGIIVALIAAVAVVMVVKQGHTESGVPEEYLPAQLTGKGLPVLIDVGAETCIPCKLMAPILKELKTELQGKIDVHFLDMDKYPALAKEYRISLKPTQIFYDAAGKERFRNEGFYSKEDILAKLKELKLLTTE